MKASFKFFVPFAVAAVALVSCQQELESNVEPQAESIHITVKATTDAIKGDADTKTCIGTHDGVENTIIWGTDEYMTIMVQSGESSYAVATSDVLDNSFNGAAEAYFEFNLTPAETAESYTYGGLYPASAAVDANAATPYNNNKNGAAFKVYLPSTQNATAESYDPSAYIMVAKPEPFASLQTDWVASFRRATALNQITLNNIPEDIVSVEFTAPEGKYMAGRRYIDLTTGESGDLYGDTRTETIEVNAALTGTSKVVWFTSWGTTIASGETFKIVAKSATKSYTREITAGAKGISFNEGYLNTLTVNMASADVADLVNYQGYYLIIATPGAWNIMTPTNTSNYYVRQSTTVSTTADNVQFDDFASVSGIDDYVWYVEKVSDGYAIKSVSTGKYVDLTADSNNAHVNDNPVAFTLTIDESTHEAVVKSQSHTTRVLRYNSGSPRFAFYAGTQNDIYMIPATVDTRTAVTLSFSEATVSKTVSNYAEFTGQTVTASPNETAITDNIVYAIAGDAIGTVNASTGVVSLNGTAGEATVTASFAGDTDYKAASASYTIKVTDPDVVVTKGAMWTYSFTSTDFATAATDYKATYNGKELVFNSTQKKNSFDTSSSRGVQFGAAVGEFTITITGYDAGVESIKLVVSSNGTANANTISATVNGKAIGSQVQLAKENNVEIEFASATVLAGGDIVLSLNDTNKSIYLKSITINEVVKTAQTISFANSSETWTIGTDCTLNTAKQGQTVSGAQTAVTYSSSDETVATVDNAGKVTPLKAGVTTITATATEDDTYYSDSDSYSLTIIDPDAGETNEPYSTGFESSEGFTAGNNYQSTVNPGPTGKQWEIYYGTVSTSSAITGSQSLALRLYTSANYGYAKMNFDVSKPTSVSFKAKAATNNSAKILLTVKESIDGGATWTAVSGYTDKALTSSATTYSFDVSGTPANYRIQFCISENSTKPSKSNAQLTIDDVTIAVGD